MLVREFDAVRSAIASQLKRFTRHSHICPELLRLNQRTSCERLPRNACRKSKIVLDLGAGSCLPTWCIRFQHEDVEAFRGAVHSCSQTCGSRTDDDEIANLRFVDERIHAEASDQLV